MITSEMNVALTIFLSAFTGTTFMTLTSYALTYIFKTQFKEPVILYKLLENSAWAGSGFITFSAGWILHYAAGIGFVILYYLLWNFAGVQPSLRNGSLLGLASGFLGVGIWWIVFQIHQNPPAINFSGYFLHLIGVHIIFGLGATWGYQLLSNLSTRLN